MESSLFFPKQSINYQQSSDKSIYREEFRRAYDEG